ncbi:MAG: penicillin-binding protein [Flavobacteriaceae bacterium]|mgnify:FL=1|jgi:cell division protein FtsI (penicillin-binding protein 3)|nr:transpeptidase family protein [Flavobacteriaceae bacterium]MDA7849262.1 transpeptidase family protein [Flavobacteriaceae bacterium]MDG1309561.1 penicillin-binding protein [Flavobacteriaceae bacterium]
MQSTEKSIMNKLYFTSGAMFIFALLVVYKLVAIQFIEGDQYRSLADDRTIKDDIIPSNRGNVYSVGGSLLATSVPKYDIRIDLVTPSDKNYEAFIEPLCDSLANFNNSSSTEYKRKLRLARENKNRYYLLARNLEYSQYLQFRDFPLLNLGAFKGGLIVEQTTKRDYPLGPIAQRLIGYERFDDQGNVTRVGIDGAFGEKYLRGEDGKRRKQKIGKGQWKPIEDYNQVEPQDGYDVYTTIDVNIQDIAHHALLEQLEAYKADHGTVVVMETRTGEIRAISNLGRNKEGLYYERLNYAVGESHEPGSTFKLMALAVALEDKVIDTTTMVDTKKGVLSYYGKKVKDSKKGGYGNISVAKAFEVSSNTGIVKAIYNAYKMNPQKFVDGLYRMNLQDSLGLPLTGEGKSIIPDPRIQNGRWSGIALQWMAYGYGVSFTPLQTLTFYNAIANDGVMVRPKFLREIKAIETSVETFDTEIINPRICSQETVLKLQQLLKNVVEKEHGTGHGLYSSEFSMAGKTGTCQKDYVNKDQLNYISSFSGYFPADDPKYSCIVVIHEPDKSVGYYGADVSGPVFKKIAQKIFTDAPVIDEVEDVNQESERVKANYDNYYAVAQKYKTIMPNLKGMSAMDAIAILENMGLRVLTEGNGTVSKQSVKSGQKIKPQSVITLVLS